MYSFILVFASLFYAHTSVSATLSPRPTSADNTLSIFHIGDHHSFLKPVRDLRFDHDGQQYSVECGGFPRMSAQIKALRAQYPASLTLHAGDALVGTHYYLLHKGLADAKLMNEICFDAYVIGNHDFDDGEATLRSFLTALQTPQCRTDIVTANVKFTDNEPLKAIIKPYTIKNVKGKQYGIIGITGVEKIVNASNPSKNTTFYDEAKTIQTYISELNAKGVDRIILLTHVGYKNDLKLAQQVKGIDVIIGGDSHTLLANQKSMLLPTDDYPKQVTHHNQKTCIAHAWHSSLMVGELHVDFNDDGTVNACSGRPHILMGKEISKVINLTHTRPLSAKEARPIIEAIQENLDITLIEPDPTSTALITHISKDITQNENQVLAISESKLCIGDVPLHKVSDICTPEEVSRGSELVNVTAQALLYATNGADIAIQNGGAVRFDMTKGEVKLEDVYRISPYANALLVFTLSHTDIKTLINQAITYAHANENQRGAYPYSAGLRFKVDMNRKKGDYAYAFEFKQDIYWLDLPTDRTYKVVTNAYLAAGRDGYEHFNQSKKKHGVSTTNMTDIDALKMYLLKERTLAHIPDEMWSTQGYVPLTP